MALGGLEDQLPARETVKVSANCTHDVITVDLSARGLASQHVGEYPPRHSIPEDEYRGGSHLVSLTQESKVTTDHRNLRPLRMPVE